MSKASFDPAKDIADQTGRVFFVTGGTTGLGAGFISLIASHNPAHIFFSGRNQTRADELIAKVHKISPTTRLTFVPCDLSSFASIQDAAKQFLERSDRLDVLMCNAGVMALEPGLSKDGYEIHFTTNHLGHALLIKLLLPTLLHTASQPQSDVRIINLSSTAHTTTPKAGIEFDRLKTDQASCGPFYTPSKFMRYGQSKLANLLYAQELAREYPDITSVSVHPGFIKTELHQHENFMDRQMVNMVSGGKWIDVKEGHYNQTWAATTKKENLVNGAYYEPMCQKLTPGTKQARDKVLARKLWDWTQKELERYS